VPESTFSIVQETTFVKACAASKVAAQNIATRTIMTWKRNLKIRDAGGAGEFAEQSRCNPAGRHFDLGVGTLILTGWFSVY
jgi:hypothetical protein